jgi:phage/plasmid-associated DNA primase
LYNQVDERALSCIRKAFQKQCQLPVVKQADRVKQTDVIAFRNGYYNYHTQEFVSTIEGSTLHFYDVDFTEALREKTTPLWDSLLSTQMTKDVKDFLE